MPWQKKTPTRRDARAIRKAILKSAQRKHIRGAARAMEITSEMRKLQNLSAQNRVAVNTFETLSYYRAAMRIVMDEMHITGSKDRKEFQRHYLHFLTTKNLALRDDAAETAAGINRILRKYHIDSNEFGKQFNEILTLIQRGKN